MYKRQISERNAGASQRAILAHRGIAANRNDTGHGPCRRVAGVTYGEISSETGREPSPEGLSGPPLLARSNVPLHQHPDHHAAVLRAARLGLVRRDRLVGPVAEYADPMQWDLVLLIEVALNGLGAVEAQLLVVCLLYTSPSPRD